MYLREFVFYVINNIGYEKEVKHMTTTEVIKLIDAGFTKDDILKLDADVKVVPDQTPAAGEEETAPAPEKKPEPEKAAPAGVILSDDQFTKLLQQLNVQGASLDVPPEADISKKLGDHFKDLLTGK
jgi:hypothetical protein